jgi:glucokinase
VGISICAQVARNGSGVLTAPNLRDYIGKPLADDLSAQLGCPVRLAHDGVCGVLAEAHLGALAPYERGAYLTLSTGTGAGIHLRNGSHETTISIQIGHQILDSNQLRCLCGQIGCLETITGGRQIELREGRPAAEIADSAFWERVADKLAIGLVNLAQLTRVEVVAVSGGISLAHPELRPRAQYSVNERISDASLRLVDAALGEDAPLVGARLLLKTPPETIIH